MVSERCKRQEGIEPTYFGILARVPNSWTRLSDGFESLSRELSEDSDFFRVFPETASKTSSFHEHDHPHGGHSSLLGFAYSKISQDLSSNRGACDVITQPYRRRKLGICAEEKHSRPVQGARGTFGSVFIPCIG